MPIPFLILCAALFLLSQARAQQPPPVLDLGCDTWVGTDALGRSLPTSGQAPAPRKDRFVGMFYFLTQGSAQWYAPNDPRPNGSVHGDDPRILRDNTEIIRRVGGDPLTKPEGWKEGGVYWWGEPAAGYFLADDPWVARRNLSMLAAAGVDVIIFDVTNGPTYANAADAILTVATDMRRQGLATPQFAYITYSSSGAVVNGLYDAVYAKDRFKDLWFLWDGKPLILGDKNGSKPTHVPPRPEVLDFFTWRHSWANTRGPGADGRDEWQWSDSGDPQLPGWHDDPKVPEEVPVLVGGWANGNLGRSFQGGDQPGRNGGTHQPPLDALDLAADTDKGLFFAQQWRHALKIDPKFVFVTGWNEWTAGRFHAPGISMLGRVTRPGQYYFVDNFNQEFSRDIMPMKGGYADNYYLQLVDHIRRFKGVRPLPAAHGFRHVNLSDPFTVWKDVEPVYRDAPGDTLHRDWPGWGGRRYTDTTGRNDLAESRVACDAQNLYFYVRTQQPLTSSRDPDWMQLLLDTDKNPQTGWHGYDFAVKGPVVDDATTTLTRLSDGKTFQIKYRAENNELALLLPRELLGLSDARTTSFDFHWLDNAPAAGAAANPADWWYVGDSAPDGRFNYRYTHQP